MICHLGRTDSLLINLVWFGNLREIRENKELVADLRRQVGWGIKIERDLSRSGHADFKRVGTSYRVGEK